MSRPIDYQIGSGAVYYSRPRSASIPRLILAALTAALIAAALGWVYIKAVNQAKWMVLAAALPIGFGLVLGLLARTAGGFAGVSRPLLAVLLALIVAGSALVSAWAFYLQRCLQILGADVSIPAIPLHIHQWPTMIREIAGISEVKVGDNYHGPGMIALIWTAESLMILAVPIAMAVTFLRGAFPCNLCRAECKLLGLMPTFTAEDHDKIVEAVQQKRFDDLLEVPPLENEDDPQINLDLRGCRKCGQTNMISVVRREWGVNRHGQATLISTTLVNGLLHLPEDLPRLKSLKEEHKQRYAADDDDNDDEADDDASESDASRQ